MHFPGPDMYAFKEVGTWNTRNVNHKKTWGPTSLFILLWPMSHAIFHYFCFGDMGSQTKMIIFLKLLLKFGMEIDIWRNQTNIYSLNYYLAMISKEYEVEHI